MYNIMKNQNIFIETDRLILRPFSEEDLDLIFRVYSDEEIMHYTPFDPLDREQARQHLEKVMEDWNRVPRLSYEMAIIVKESGEKAGRAHILIDPESDTGMIGWFLLKKFWGRHYATEMAEYLIRYSFDTLHLHRVNALCNPENIASWKVLEKAGMRREALMKKKARYVKNGVTSWHDELQYAILEPSYEEKERETDDKTGS